MPHARVSVDAEGLSKSCGFTVIREDLPEGSISGRDGLEALDRVEDVLCQIKDYSYAALRIAEGQIAGSIENERLSAIYALISHIRSDIRALEADFRTVSGFCTSLCVQVK